MSIRCINNRDYYVMTQQEIQTRMLELETAIASLEKRWDAGMKRATAHGFSDAVAEDYLRSEGPNSILKAIQKHNEEWQELKNRLKPVKSPFGKKRPVLS